MTFWRKTRCACAADICLHAAGDLHLTLDGVNISELDLAFGLLYRGQVDLLDEAEMTAVRSVLEMLGISIKLDFEP